MESTGVYWKPVYNLLHWHFETWVVVSDLQGVSARAMIEAITADNMDPSAMAKLAKGRLRNKIPQLVEALTGHVRPHHRFMLEEILLHIDKLGQRIDALDARITALVAPHAELIERLDEITGVSIHTAPIILAEIGPSVANRPSDRHLAS